MTSIAGASGPQGPDDEQLMRYLLGELSELEEAAIDHALADDDVWAALRLAEDELLDAYASGQLDAHRRQRLADRLAASPRLRERVDLQRDLGTLARSRARRPRRRSARAVVAMLGAFAVVAVLVVAVAWRGNAGHGGDADGDVVALTLVPTTRGGAMPEVRVTGRRVIALSVLVDTEESFPRYRVRIPGAGAPLWAQDGVTTADGMLALRVPTSVLPDGVRELELFGVGTSGDEVRLGTRSFRILR